MKYFKLTLLLSGSWEASFGGSQAVHSFQDTSALGALRGLWKRLPRNSSERSGLTVMAGAAKEFIENFDASESGPVPRD